MPNGKVGSAPSPSSHCPLQRKGAMAGGHRDTEEGAAEERDRAGQGGHPAAATLREEGAQSCFAGYSSLQLCSCALCPHQSLV